MIYPRSRHHRRAFKTSCPILHRLRHHMWARLHLPEALSPSCRGWSTTQLSGPVILRLEGTKKRALVRVDLCSSWLQCRGITESYLSEVLGKAVVLSGLTTEDVSFLKPEVYSFLFPGSRGEEGYAAGNRQSEGSVLSRPRLEGAPVCCPAAAAGRWGGQLSGPLSRGADTGHVCGRSSGTCPASWIMMEFPCVHVTRDPAPDTS